MIKTIAGAISVAAMVLGATISDAHAGWGCGARNASGSIGRSWSLTTEGEARDHALDACGREAHRHRETAPCRVASCRPNVDFLPQAYKLWPDDNSW